jgi:hypothetical protein
VRGHNPPFSKTANTRGSGNGAYANRQTALMFLSSLRRINESGALQHRRRTRSNGVRRVTSSAVPRRDEHPCDFHLTRFDIIRCFQVAPDRLIRSCRGDADRRECQAALSGCTRRTT